MQNVTIASRSIGESQPTYIVGETAWAHEGSIEKLEQMIEIAASGGADAVNFHMTELSAYITPYYGESITTLDSGKAASAYEYLEKINLPPSAYEQAARTARGHGLAVSVMVNDQPSLEHALEATNPDVLMLHPSCIGERALLEGVARAGKPLVLYVGGLHLGEIEQAVLTARALDCPGLILQHGFQSYPTPLEFNNLRYIATLKQLFDVPIAFGDHTDGDDPFALVIPSLAVAAGAHVIEKHLTPDRKRKGEDFESALDATNFGTFVSHVRNTEIALGANSWRPLSDRELKYRSNVRKRLVASADLKKGEALKSPHLSVKRATEGLYPEQSDVVIGRVLARDVRENEAITMELFGDGSNS